MLNVWTFVVFLLIVVAEQPPLDFGSNAGQLKQQGISYGKTLALRTIGFGIGCSIVLGILNFFVCIGFCSRLSCCCRSCKRGQGNQSSSHGSLGQLLFVSPTAHSVHAIEVVSPPGRKNSWKDNTAESRPGTLQQAKRMHLWLYIVNACFLITFVVCASFVRPYTLMLDGSLSTAFSEVKQLMGGSANFLCSQRPDKSSQWGKCKADSIGGFIQDANSFMVGNFDQIISRSQAVGSTLNETLLLLQLAGQGPGYINGAISAFLNMNSSAVQLKKQLAFLSNPMNTGAVSLVDQLPRTSALPLLTVAQLANLRTADSSLKATVVGLNLTKTELVGTSKTLSNFIATIDGISGNEPPGKKDHRIALQHVLSKGLSMLSEISTQIMGISSDVDMAENKADLYRFWFLPGFTAFAFLPAFVVFVTSLCMPRCQTKPMGCSVTFMFLMNGLYGIAFGIFLTFAVVNSDVCRWHLQLLGEGLSRVPELSASAYVNTIGVENFVRDVLTCPDTGSKNNLVGILGGTEKILNVTSLLSSSFGFINSAIIQIENSVGGVNTSMQNYGGLNVSERIPFNFTTLVRPLTTLQNQLPSLPFNRTSPASQAKMSTFYKDPFFFVNYRKAIARVNTILGNVTFSSGKQPPHSYNENTIQYFTLINISTPLNPYVSLATVYSSPHNYLELQAAVNSTDSFTRTLSTLVISTGNIATSVHGAINNANQINGNLTAFYLHEHSVQQLYFAFKIGLQKSRIFIGTLLGSVQFFTQLITSTQAFVDGLPSYTKCGFIGHFYRTFYLETWCADITATTHNIGITFAALVFGMFAAHFFLALLFPWFSARKSALRAVAPAQNGEQKMV